MFRYIWILENQREKEDATTLIKKYFDPMQDVMHFLDQGLPDRFPQCKKIIAIGIKVQFALEIKPGHDKVIKKNNHVVMLVKSFKNYYEDLELEKVLEVQFGFMLLKEPMTELGSCHLINDPKELEKALSQSNWWAVDIETVNQLDKTKGSLDPWSGEIFSIAFSTYVKNYSIIYDRKFKEVLVNFFQDKNKGLIVHNGMFEFAFFIYCLGVKPHNNYHDTQILQYLLDENMPRNLKYLAWIYSKYGGYELALENDFFQNLDKHSINKRLRYNEIDAMVTYEIYETLYPKLIAKQQLVYRIMLDAQLELVEMYLRGIRIDFESLRRFESQTNRAIDYLMTSLLENPIIQQAQAKMIEEAEETKSRYEWKFSGNKCLKAIFQDILEIPVLKTTKTGKTSFDKETMIRMCKNDGDSGKVARKIQSLKKKEADLAKFTEDKIVKHLQNDGLLHPKIYLTTSKTGRLSTKEMTLQNVATCRRYFFLPKKEGYGIISSDFSQIDLRALATLSGDNVLINAFKSGEDVHDAGCKNMFGELSKKLRKIYKTIIFGIVNKAGPRTIAENLWIANDYQGAKEDYEKQGKELILRFFKSHPKIRFWINEVVNFGRKYGCVVSPFGRIRHLPNINSPNKERYKKAERQATNSLLQGWAGEIVLQAIINLGAAGYSIIGQNVDSILVECLLEKIFQEAPVIKEIMETPQYGTEVVPLHVKVEWGENFGIMEKINL